MTPGPPENEGDQLLLDRARAGDRQAVDALLANHRDRIKRIVALRLDRAVFPRVDASDIVQDTLIEAHRRMTDYLQRNPMPFELWLRKTAIERLISATRKHRDAEKRSVAKEIPLPEQSSIQLAQQICAHDSTPSQQASRRETAIAVRRAMAQLPDQDREIVLMRWIEGLSYTDIGAVLEIEPVTARKRLGRALIRLKSVLAAHGLAPATQVGSES